MSDCEIPESLNEKLFENALTNKFKKPVEISGLKISMGSKKGDNYTSDIYRVMVDYSVDGLSKSISLIAKYIKEDKEAMKIFEELQFISKETEMYSTIVPKISEIINEKCSAECYLVTDNPTIFILEDLKASGYDIADRMVGLDLVHCKAFLTKIAKFHAASMVLVSSDPGIFENFLEGMYKKPKGEDDKGYEFATNAIREVIEVVSTWEGFESIVEKLKKIRENFIELGLKCVNQKSDFPVLNHGDAWTNNFMFKYEEGSQVPVDIAFVDFQLPFYSSFAIDFHYFMTNSPNNEIRENYQEECLKIYHESLVNTLKSLKYPKIPTLGQLKDEMKKFQFYGVSTALSILPVIVMAKNDDFDYNFEELLDSQDFRKSMYHGKRFRELLRPLLIRYDEIGALEV